MDHLSEILKIIDGALKANASMAANYAGLLADKLEQSGERQQAALVRERLVRAPATLAMAQDASRGIGPGLPTDTESRLHTVDVARPTATELSLLLPSAVLRRVREFLDSVMHFDELARAGAAQASRLLLYGPPGTGKTRTAHWIAGQLNLPILTVRADTLISSLLGQTSRNLRRVFDYAQERPCILFLDEFDALAGARGNEKDVGELQRVVISLLQNIDALPTSTVLIASTNLDTSLDKAVWRRFPYQIAMPLPDRSLRLELWRNYLGDFAPHNVDYSKIADQSEGLSGAAIEQIAIDSKRHAILAKVANAPQCELLRRLALVQASVKGIQLSTIEDEVRWLRKWDSGEFSIRELARLYGLSTRAISNILNQDGSHGKKASISKQSIHRRRI